MAKCGCGTTTCSCKVIAGANTTVTGSGSTSDPYVVSAALTCASARACFSASLGVAYNMATGNFTADLSSDPGNILVLGTDTGLYVPTPAAFSCAAARLCFSGGDALNYDSSTGDFDVCLSTDVGNTITLGTDGCLFVPAGAVLVADTPTVNLTLTGATITGDVIIDPLASNILTATANGLLATIAAGPCGLLGDGTAANPLIANVEPVWPFACAQSANAGDVYCDPTTGRLQVEPPRFSEVFSNDSGINLPATAVPNVQTVVDSASVLIQNPDPCRDLTVLIVWESDVTFQVAVGSQVNVRMNGDVMWQYENTGTAVATVAGQTAREQTLVVAPGALVNPSFPIAIDESQGNGSTYTRVQWRIAAHGVSA